MSKGKPAQNVPEGSPVRPTTNPRPHQPEAAEELGTPTPAAQDLRDWLRLAHDLEDKALYETKDLEALQLVHRFLSGLVQVRQLLDAFRAAQGKLEGDNGVAARLNISRNAVYLRLDMVQLTADHFREEGVELPTLVARSQRLGSLLEKMKEKMA
jgi:hypothetical protein